MTYLKTTFITALVTTNFVSPVFAHTGHDHGHWSSSLLHLGLVAGGVASLLLVRQLIKQTRQSRKDHS